ncbi:MAG: hypothetical protein K0U24_04470 [Gammaproteobacteria bacterium]|nr:hypothetical protein [Gammaproteobacteria bacterium]MCH9716782.1 hypothetical protein [Gammaproteobacteria bacterium]MCH9763470.1 hypothetical protein [Gammaproteobacteria bacterium]
MKYLARMAVTGVMVFTLSACGGDDVPQAPATDGNDLIQAQQPAPGVPAASEAVQAPAASATPTEEQVEGASAEE